MNPDIIFAPRITSDEAVHISEQMTTAQWRAIEDAYTKNYKQCDIKDLRWKSMVGLTAVYVLGFVSGARYARESKRGGRTT